MRIISSNIWKKISDKEYIKGLKNGNQNITEAFFYGLCSYIINDIRYSLMGGRIDYDELINEFFIYLSEDSWHKLDTFAGINGCSLKTWIGRVAWRYFLNHRDHLVGNSMHTSDVMTFPHTIDNRNMEISMDINATFQNMENKRYVKVLKWILVGGYNSEEVAKMLDTTESNVYNIKHRAIVQFALTYNAC